MVDTLNARLGKNWGDLGIEAIKFLLRKTLPAPLVALVDVVHGVELNARRTHATGHTKRQLAAWAAITSGRA